MATPLKKLNLDSLVAELKNCNGADSYEEIEVIFSPLHSDEYIIFNNKLIINFFRVKPSDIDDRAFIGDVELINYIADKIKELLSK